MMILIIQKIMALCCVVAQIYLTHQLFVQSKIDVIKKNNLLIKIEADVNEDWQKLWCKETNMVICYVICMVGLGALVAKEM